MYAGRLQELMRNKAVLVEMWVCMYSCCSTKINRVKLFINIDGLIRTDVIHGVTNNVGLLTRDCVAVEHQINDD